MPKREWFANFWVSSQDSMWVIHADKPIIGVFCFFHAIASKYFVLLCICWLYYTHFEITGGLCNLIGSNWCDLFSNHTIFALNRIFFPTNEQVTLKTKQPIRFQGLFKVTNQIAGKWKTKSIMWQILQLLFPKLLLFPHPKMDEFNFRPAQYCINKIFELTKSCIWAISKWM